MKFTKEQIESTIKIYHAWDSKRYPDFSEYLDSLVKPQRKKIVVEIEANDCDIIGILNRILQGEKSLCEVTSGYKWKAKLLPEVFSREDMIEFAKIDHVRYCDIESNLKNFLSERSKNDN